MDTVFDVVIYGGSPAGLIAGVAASRRGSRVSIVTPSQHLGGMMSSGLGASDIADPAIIGGLPQEFFRRVGHHYGGPEQFHFEPHVAEEVFETFVREASLDVLRGRRVQSVRKTGRRLVDFELDNGATVSGRQFIDASYEGDLLALAGVSYRVGRESTAEYGERLNGVLGDSRSHQFDLPIDPYIRPGDPSSGLIPLVEPADGAVPGSGDRRVEAYNFRLCLTREARNRLPVGRPHGYHPFRYEVRARLLEARRSADKTVRLSDLFLIVELPHGKADFNNFGPLSTDHVGANAEYPEGDPGRSSKDLA